MSLVSCDLELKSELNKIKAKVITGKQKSNRAKNIKKQDVCIKSGGNRTTALNKLQTNRDMEKVLLPPTQHLERECPYHYTLPMMN